MFVNFNLFLFYFVNKIIRLIFYIGVINYDFPSINNTINFPSINNTINFIINYCDYIKRLVI